MYWVDLKEDGVLGKIMSTNIDKLMEDLSGSLIQGVFVKLFRAAEDGDLYPISIVIQYENGGGEIRICGTGHGLECIDSVLQASSLGEYGEILISDQWDGVDLKELVGRKVLDYCMVEDFGNVVSISVVLDPGRIQVSSNDDELDVLVSLNA